MERWDELLVTDQNLRAEANELLEDRGLRKLLNEYAPNYLTGSYDLQLMVWRDLDIAMDAPQITIAEFFELGKRITELLSPWKMSFTNHRDRECKPYPRGLYWGIRLGEIMEGAWKIDLWALDSAQCRNKLQECERLKNRLDGENRVTILSLKSRLWNDRRYRDTITSQDIYDAVLLHNVSTLDEFWQYIGKRDSGSQGPGRAGSP